MKAPALFLALAVVAAAAASPRADDELEWTPRGILSLGVRGTYFWDEPTKAIETGKTFGGIQIRGYWWKLGLELSSDYRRIQLPQRTEINVFPVHGDLLFFPVDWRLAPYLVGGWNWVTTDRIFGTLGSTDDREGWEAGGGLEFRWDPRWSLDAEYRRLWLTNKSVPYANAKDGAYLMASLNYHFDIGD